MNRLPRIGATALVVPLVLAGVLGAAGCSTKADAKPEALTGTALANAKTGEACGYLAGAEANPVGSKTSNVGAGMLAHAVTLALQAKDADARWKPFYEDMDAIGTAGGLPALKRVTAVCAQWGKDHDYYLTHAPKG